MEENEIRLLRQGALDRGIELTEEQERSFRIYLDTLWAWNQRMNLTGVSSRERVVVELFLDSLIPAPFLPGQGRLLDVGSGAGLPGIPLKIYCPSLEVILLEANAKKVSFLKQIIRRLMLDKTTVIRGRIERERIHLDPGGYPFITARALAPLHKTIAWCAPLLCPGGLLVSYLGGRPEEALEKSRKVMEDQKLRVERKISYILPGMKEKRNTLIFRKKTT